jgi:hypothetical protein
LVTPYPGVEQSGVPEVKQPTSLVRETFAEKLTNHIETIQASSAPATHKGSSDTSM